MNTQNDYLNAACDLARRGGMLAKSLMGKTRTSLKNDRSVVTEADKKVQDMIVGELARMFPDHGLIAEEETELTAARPGKTAEYVWTIDPIDGTRNFAAGICTYCCSIALLHQGRPIVGAIYEPNFDWLFSASEDTPALLNGQPIAVRNKCFSQETVLAFTIATYASRPRNLHRLLDACTLRNTGTVAFHLGLVASGKMDATINISGKIWDIAAGCLIAQCAGGMSRLLDANCTIIDRPLWPMNLTQYNNEAIPIVVGNHELITNLKTLLEGA